jgi:hypothetical protein
MTNEKKAQEMPASCVLLWRALLGLPMPEPVLGTVGFGESDCCHRTNLSKRGGPHV